jgi:hypothetical protein
LDDDGGHFMTHHCRVPPNQAQGPQVLAVHVVLMCVFFQGVIMKKYFFAALLLSLSSLSFAGGCWQNGKYVQCVKNMETGPATSEHTSAL